MKVYVSADIEGVTGVTDWDEIKESNPGFRYFQEQMTQEVVAACEGAIAAGAREVVVKDAHGHAKNIVPAKLPECVSIIRGWSGHPFLMMEQLDKTFDAAVMIGYHAPSGSNGNPLCHTIHGDIIKLNGQRLSEFVINAYTAMMVGVPVVFVSGDHYICHEVKEFNSKIETFATGRGLGGSVTSVHPKLAIQHIRQGVERVLRTSFRGINPSLPRKFDLQIEFKKHQAAYRMSFYPGAKQVGENMVTYEATDYFDILRFLAFYCPVG